MVTMHHHAMQRSSSSSRSSTHGSRGGAAQLNRRARTPHQPRVVTPPTQQQEHHQTSPQPLAPRQLQQQQPQRRQQPRPEASSTRRRRQLLAGALGGIAALQFQQGIAPRTAQAAAAGTPSCQLQESSVGMQWCDIAVGEGQLPIKGAFTKLNYTAQLASSGAVFDSTYQRRTPLLFKVGEHEMIEAFDVGVLGAEGMPPMREGGRRLLVVPPGAMQRQGVKSLTWVTGLLGAIEEAGETVSADGSFNSVLQFEIELVPKRKR